MFSNMPEQVWLLMVVGIFLGLRVLGFSEKIG